MHESTPANTIEGENSFWRRSWRWKYEGFQYIDEHQLEHVVEPFGIGQYPISELVVKPPSCGETQQKSQTLSWWKDFQVKLQHDVNFQRDPVPTRRCSTVFTLSNNVFCIRQSGYFFCKLNFAHPLITNSRVHIAQKILLSQVLYTTAAEAVNWQHVDFTISKRAHSLNNPTMGDCHNIVKS
jgi:hypothetical protein